MKPNFKNTILAALFTVALGLLLAGCGASANAPQDQQPAYDEPSKHTGNYAGKVEGTDAFVAVVVDRNDKVLAYLCDGKEGESATLAEWFTGAVADDGSLDLRSEGGAHLVANVSGEAAEGSVTLPDGEERAFAASPVEAPAGLYRAEETVEGEEYVGGWIELANEEERGAVKNRSSGFIDLNGDLSRPSEPVDGFNEQGVGI